MVSAPRCRPGARGLLALLLLLPLPGARGLCGALPRLSHASPQITSHTEGFPIGTEVTYRCLKGFVKIPGKSDTVVCLSNSEWSTFGEFCNGGCGAPPRLKSATLSKEDGQNNYYPKGTTASYVCRPGYESTKVKAVVTCLENLTWSEAPEFCRGKSCGVPKGPEHGRAVVITNDLYGARANVICDEGFRLHGRAFIQCLLKGDQVEWSQLPICQGKSCGVPKGPEHGRAVVLTNDLYGARANIICDEGFTLHGRTFIQCLLKGDQVEWSQLPTCQAQCRRRRDTNGKAVPYGCDDGSGKSHAITCSPPPNITNGMHNGSNVEIFVYNSSVTYECDHNFSLTGEASIHCTTKDNISGVWNGSAPECKGRLCKQLELENGRVHLTDHRVGATATFSCNEGYRLIGTTSAQCVVAENGVNLDKDLPHCQAIPCHPPPDIANGSHTGQSEQEFSFGSAVTYKCDKGFSLIGEASIHCTTKDNVNGEWSGPVPKCKGQCGAPPSLRRASPYDTNCTEGCPIGTGVTYKCSDGFVKIPGKSDTVVCLENSEWSTFGEFCNGKSCGVPKGPEHGRAVVITNDLYGARANIICDEGFTLHGRTFIQCLLKGDQVEWSQLPTCQAITCSPPPNIANGTHNGSNVEIFVCNSLVTYKCDHNFSLTGEASIQCTTKDNITGVWNGSAPECKDQCVLPRRRRHDTNGKEVSDSCSGAPGKIPEPGFDTRIGIPGIGSNIATVAGITVAIAIAIAIVTGIVAALKKKGSYSVNPGSPKHQITTEHDSHLNESKCNLIFKV